MNHNDTGWMTMTENDMSGTFKGPRKLCFSWPSKQRHLENTLKVKGNEKLDHVNCALCKWPIISSVPDTSAPHFGIHSPKM